MKRELSEVSTVRNGLAWIHLVNITLCPIQPQNPKRRKITFLIIKNKFTLYIHNKYKHTHVCYGPFYRLSPTLIPKFKLEKILKKVLYLFPLLLLKVYFWFFKKLNNNKKNIYFESFFVNYQTSCPACFYVTVVTKMLGKIWTNPAIGFFLPSCWVKCLTQPSG